MIKKINNIPFHNFIWLSNVVFILSHVGRVSDQIVGKFLFLDNLTCLYKSLKREKLKICCCFFLNDNVNAVCPILVRSRIYLLCNLPIGASISWLVCECKTLVKVALLLLISVSNYAAFKRSFKSFKTSFSYSSRIYGNRQGLVWVTGGDRTYGLS